MMMYEHFITVGLFDRESHTQKIDTESARMVVENLIISAGMCCTIFTQGVYGVYQHSDGSIVREPSMRIEIADVKPEQVERVIKEMKKALNQETIMWKVAESHIAFYGDDSNLNDI